MKSIKIIPKRGKVKTITKSKAWLVGRVEGATAFPAKRQVETIKDAYDKASKGDFIFVLINTGKQIIGRAKR